MLLLRLCVFASLTFISGCQQFSSRYGYVFPLKDTQIVGMSEKQVLAQMGEPSCRLSSDPSWWFYLSQEYVTQALCEPSVPSVQCRILHFQQKHVAQIYNSFQPIAIVPSSEAIPYQSICNEGFFGTVLRGIRQSSEVKVKPY